MTVHFVPWNASRDLLKETERLYDAAGIFDCVKKDDLVAIKLHVGELGNPPGSDDPHLECCHLIFLPMVCGRASSPLSL